MKKVFLTAIFLASILFTLSSLYAAELMSGAAFIEQIEKARGDTSSKTNLIKPAIADFRAELTNFIQRRAQLAPAEGAAQWLAFVHRAATNTVAQDPRNPLTQDLLAALPEPSAWPELEKIIAPREIKTISDLGLRVLAARLVNQMAPATAAVEEFAKKASETDKYKVESLNEILERDKNQTAEALLKRLDRLASASARGEIESVELPRLVPTLSPAEAEAALKKVLPKIKVPITINYADNESSAYAWKAALAVVDQLPIPQWSLIQSADAAPLYEALEKKFPKDAAESDEDDTADKLPGVRRAFSAASNGITAARAHYVAALIKRGEIAKAVAIARKEPSLHLDSDDDKIPAGPLTDFYIEALKADPSLQWWAPLVYAAASAGRTADALKLAEDSLVKPNLTPQLRGSLKAIVASSKLADDRVEEGLAALRENAGSQQPDEYSENVGPTQLALLGAALKRPEVLKEAIDLAKKQADQSTPQRPSAYSYGYGGGNANLALLLAANGLPAEALDMMVNSIAKIPRNNNNQLSTPLSAVATIYVRQGKPSDALHLLERSPDWNIADLVTTLRDEPDYSHGYRQQTLPLPYIAAAGLAAGGREAEARTVLYAFLRANGGNDRGYELLLKLDGQKAIETLDAIYAIDRFEERPLIWKALLQFQAGDLEAAEKTVRAAIAVDPSDGEQGPGDRLRAYAFLADIRAARGDQDQAKIFRGAVQAIRLSEEADLDFAAGLLRRAIAKYRESLKLFADAYCVQSRMAVQLTAIGLHQEAEEHYRRAFELMPDSFGRVESHCFGCERAFGGEKAQGIAEQTFTSLLQKTPDKPQLHYLFGYLRHQQGRDAEAIPHLRKAVQLDADYLSAWKLLHELSGKVKMSPQEEDDAALNLLRLDPAGRHSYTRFGGYGGNSINNLARLWNAYREAAPRIPEAPTQLFRLPASAEAIEKRKTEGNENRFGYYEQYSAGMNAGRTAKNPATAIASDSIIAAAGQILLPAASPY